MNENDAKLVGMITLIGLLVVILTPILKEPGGRPVQREQVAAAEFRPIMSPLKATLKTSYALPDGETADLEALLVSSVEQVGEQLRFRIDVTNRSACAVTLLLKHPVTKGGQPIASFLTQHFLDRPVSFKAFETSTFDVLVADKAVRTVEPARIEIAFVGVSSGSYVAGPASIYIPIER